MELRDKHVVITGAASGIGRAMALRFADDGARVVVSDLDTEGAADVAAETDGLAVGCDVADPEDVARLIGTAEQRFGPIDLFCANAGIGGGTDLDTTDDEWDAAFDVNVRSHITAARLLVPGWVERGEGYFLSTASAAGLLSVIGSAPYMVTKHAAVAFAEWLAFTYGDRGVGVSCLCPMAVKTKLLEEGLALPGEAGVGLRVTNSAGEWLEPDAVAGSVVDGLRDERFLILPHPQVHDLFQMKAADPDGWVARVRDVRTSALAGTT